MSSLARKMLVGIQARSCFRLSPMHLAAVFLPASSSFKRVPTVLGGAPGARGCPCKFPPRGTSGSAIGSQRAERRLRGRAQTVGHSVAGDCKDLGSSWIWTFCVGGDCVICFSSCTLGLEIILAAVAERSRFTGWTDCHCWGAKRKETSNRPKKALREHESFPPLGAVMHQKTKKSAAPPVWNMQVVLSTGGRFAK